MDRTNVDIVLIRMDKIGDLVLSMPVDQHPAFKNKSVHWFVSKGMGFIATHAVPVRGASEFARAFSGIEFWRMVKWFKAHNPKTAIFLHSSWWASLAAFCAGVPQRVGRRSQWHSFLFLNIAVRQKRSLSDRHESDFNFDLVEAALRKIGQPATHGLEKIKEHYLELNTRPENDAATLKRFALPARQYRVVHPGMAGSALNWPTANYKELIEQLLDKNRVVITGTKMDSAYLEPLKDLIKNPRLVWLVEQLNATELLSILAQAQSVVAPSTGVLHLSASLGTPSLGIYSPRKVEHPRRWGPKGPFVQILLPTTQPDSEVADNIMNQILPAEVLSGLTQLEERFNASSQSHPTLSV